MPWMMELTSDKTCWNNTWKKSQACVNINKKRKKKNIEILHCQMKLGGKKITPSERGCNKQKVTCFHNSYSKIHLHIIYF